MVAQHVFRCRCCPYCFLALIGKMSRKRERKIKFLKRGKKGEKAHILFLSTSFYLSEGTSQEPQFLLGKMVLPVSCRPLPTGKGGRMRPSAVRCCVPAASRPHQGSASPLPFRALLPGELTLGRHWEGEERVKVLCDLPMEAVSLGRQGLLLYDLHAGWREMVDPSPSPRAEVYFYGGG